MRKEIISAILCLWLLVPVTSHAAVPEWLRNLAQQPPKKYDDRVNAVILLHETETTVKDNGETVTRVRQAVRVLRPEGRTAAYQQVPFDDETKLNYMKGWSITGKGQEYQSKRSDIVELSGEGSEIYSDEKYQAMRVPGVDVGTIVGVEWEQKRHPYTFEDHWFFQDWFPVERARFVLHLPVGWDFRAAWINHAPQAPASQSRTYVWEMSDVPRIEAEEAMPPWRALAGQLIVTFFSDKTKGRSYANWNDFGAWYSQLTAGARDPSTALRQKVQELAPASLPLPERIHALARFVQHDIRYAAIEIGIGGYQPHPAVQVLRDGYGDCKDKATLLSAMLSQIDVNSYYVPVHTDRGIYTDKTPPTNGFNHVVLAIQLPGAATRTDPMPAVYEHPSLGRLLIFDPTSTVVPFGQIPSYEQDNYGLLITGHGGELIHLPLSRPESNRVDRNAKFTLQPDGTLKAEVEEVRTGGMAAESRLRLAHERDADRGKALERFVGRELGNFQLERSVADNLDDIDKDLVIHYTFTAERYAKNAGALLLLRPSVLGENLGPLDMTKPRHYPYEFQLPTLQTDTFEFVLPEGYKVDALPDAVQAAFAFAGYSSKFVNDGAGLKYVREYKIKATSVPADRITDLGKLFSEMNEDERNMAVLKKAH